MATLTSEEQASVDHMAGSPCNEEQLLDKSKADSIKSSKVSQEEAKLPPLSAAEWRVYNSMADHMDQFHNHFRHTWETMYKACENGRRPPNLSLSQFLNLGLQFIQHLEAHHSIEERYIFPVLAKKMPEFKAGKNAAELLRQHQEIHKGMDVFQDYLRSCKTGEVDFELNTLKTKMDLWGTVLWTHLDQEVATLGAENMRKYWSIDEMRSMPM